MTSPARLGDVQLEVSGTPELRAGFARFLPVPEQVAVASDRVRLELRAGSTVLPDRGADRDAWGSPVWFGEEPGDVTVHDPLTGWTAEVTRGRALLTGPPEPAAVDRCGTLLLLALASLLRPRDRFLVHAATASRSGRTVLVLGSSGAGKSTFSLGAVRSGWDLLGDDLAVLRLAPDGVRVRGVLRVPFVPAELPGVDTPALQQGRRLRRALDVALLSASEHPLTDVVVLAHSTGAAALVTVDGATALRSLLISHPCYDPRLSHGWTRVAAAAARTRCWRLEHDVDVQHRLPAVGRLLSGLLDETQLEQVPQEGRGVRGHL